MLISNSAIWYRPASVRRADGTLIDTGSSQVTAGRHPGQTPRPWAKARYQSEAASIACACHTNGWGGNDP
jgi:hypothetical protein